MNRHPFFSFLRPFYRTIHPNPEVRKPPHKLIEKLLKELRKELPYVVLEVDGQTLHAYSTYGEPLFGAHAVVRNRLKRDELRHGRPAFDPNAPSTAKLAMASPSAYKYQHSRSGLHSSEVWASSIKEAVAFAKKAAAGVEATHVLHQHADDWYRTKEKVRGRAQDVCTNLKESAVDVMAAELQRLQLEGVTLSKETTAFLSDLAEAQDHTRSMARSHTTRHHSLLVLQTDDPEVVEVMHAASNAQAGMPQTVIRPVKVDLLVDDIVTKLTLVKMAGYESYVPGVGMQFKDGSNPQYVIERLTDGPIVKEEAV